MAGVNGIENFNMLYEIKFETVIRGHHVYKVLYLMEIHNRRRALCKAA